MKSYNDTVENYQVLELESTNVKALYRRAQAYIELVDLELAELDIKKALEIDPNNRYWGPLVCETNVIENSLFLPMHRNAKLFCVFAKKTTGTRHCLSPTSVSGQ
jgi:tetratricopeptide (TPR) repeat protein